MRNKPKNNTCIRKSVDVIKKAEDSLQGAQCLRKNRKASHEHLYLPLDGKGQTVL